MSTDKAPLLLQRNCGLGFRVRADGDDSAGTAGTFEGALAVARAALGRGAQRAWVDLYMSYDGYAANGEAASRAGRAEVRLAAWEVFVTEVIYCPVGRRQLDPKMLAAVRAKEEAAR